MNPLSPNIFRFKSETRRSMHSLTPFGFDDVITRVHHNPVKAPRKVLDATALQDDLYLNLVDWSLHNVLAIGLGNFVYLWNACSSTLTKLCDLGIDDSVCSVGRDSIDVFKCSLLYRNMNSCMGATSNDKSEKKKGDRGEIKKEENSITVILKVVKCVKDFGVCFYCRRRRLEGHVCPEIEANDECFMIDNVFEDEPFVYQENVVVNEDIKASLQEDVMLCFPSATNVEKDYTKIEEFGQCMEDVGPNEEDVISNVMSGETKVRENLGSFVIAILAAEAASMSARPTIGMLLRLMKRIIWNCRGMGRPDFTSYLSYLSSLVKLDFFCFFYRFFGFNPEARFGGICVCWNSSLINLNVISASSRYIHALVKDVHSTIEYFATFV
ncbi:protein FIZZY-RELATED 2-like [Pyrus ussuriensis x Pyrus communis]|uniref:Protein FIZZY-RELATED 2-like n=1 Tax=Pyrus ussuriensis x Pyrus communis TaxID=2448454 RepID=A0A5N5GQ44_9ROSA|nr:protein FIZZY-RELATED 2-like [Pyrus ussuriensis x Pyrus communis]